MRQGGARGGAAQKRGNGGGGQGIWVLWEGLEGTGLGMGGGEPSASPWGTRSGGLSTLSEVGLGDWVIQRPRAGQPWDVSSSCKDSGPRAGQCPHWTLLPMSRHRGLAGSTPHSWGPSPHSWSGLSGTQHPLQ